MKSRYPVWVVLVSLFLLVSVVSADDPWAGFVPSSISGTAPYTVTFVSISYNSPTAWNWSFRNIAGNNTEVWFSQETNATLTFNWGGNYSIRLNSSNSDGYNITPYLVFVNVTGPPLLEPVAGFIGIPTSGVTPLSVSFIDASTNSPDNWDWYMYDNETKTSDDQTPSHVFTGVGTHNIRLYVSNAYGCGNWSNRTGYITVYATHVEENRVDWATDNNIFFVIMSLVGLIAAIIGLSGVLSTLNDVRSGNAPSTALILSTVSFFIGVTILVILFIMMPTIVTITEV